MPDDLSPLSPKKRNIGEIYGDQFLNKLLNNVKLKKQKQVMGDQHLQNDYEESDSDQDDPLARIPDDEVQLIEEFLDKFVFSSDANTAKETIDLNLALKALP